MMDNPFNPEVTVVAMDLSKYVNEDGRLLANISTSTWSCWLWKQEDC